MTLRLRFFVTVLPLLSAVFLLSLSGCFQPEPEPRVITESSYKSGQPMKERLYIPGSPPTNLEMRTYDKQGTLIKVKDMQDGTIDYYDELYDTLRTRSGLRAYLQGAWKRGGIKKGYKKLPNGQMADVRTKEARYFRGDSLVLVQDSEIIAPSGRRLRSVVEVCFRVRYLAPLRISLEEKLYVKTRSATEGRSSLTPDLRAAVVDTLRLFRPDLYYVQTASPGGGSRYHRQDESYRMLMSRP